MAIIIQGHNTDYTGNEIDGLLDKIDDLGLATTTTAGLMSAADKSNLDNAPNEVLQRHSGQRWVRLSLTLH